MSEENNNSGPEKKKLFDENIAELWALRPPKKEKPFWLRKKFLVSTVIIIVIGLCVWDIIDAPPFWHFRQRDKIAIMEYQKGLFPGAKIKERFFPFFGSEHFIGFPTPSHITFEYDGVTFEISAKDGKVTGDNYDYSKAKKRIEDKLWDFLTPEKIKPDFLYVTFDFDRYTLPEKLSDYKNVKIRICFNNQISDPRYLTWLYDFYEYWQTHSELSDYNVEIVFDMDEKALYTLAFDANSKLTREKVYSSFEIDDLTHSY